LWIDDPNFDLTFHVRRAALPSPRGRRELVDYVQRVVSRPLDRTKPLWEAYIIEEMENDLSAVITKVHHAMVDGLAAIDIASTMFDFSPEAQILTPPPWEPAPEPTRPPSPRHRPAHVGLPPRGPDPDPAPVGAGTGAYPGRPPSRRDQRAGREP